MAAEQEVFNVVTTGAESDLEMVTRIARSMVGRWGMSERIGRLSVLPAEGDPRMAGISDGMLDAVDEEVRRITDECYAEARRLLKENRDKLDAIVAQLLVHESLDEPDIYAAAGVPRPVVGGSVSASARPHAEPVVSEGGAHHINGKALGIPLAVCPMTAPIECTVQTGRVSRYDTPICRKDPT